MDLKEDVMLGVLLTPPCRLGSVVDRLWPFTSSKLMTKKKKCSASYSMAVPGIRKKTVKNQACMPIYHSVFHHPMLILEMLSNITLLHVLYKCK